MLLSIGKFKNVPWMHTKWISQSIPPMMATRPIAKKCPILLRIPQTIKNPIAPKKLVGSIQFQAITPDPIEIPIVTNHIKPINAPVLSELLILLLFLNV